MSYDCPLCSKVVSQICKKVVTLRECKGDKDGPKKGNNTEMESLGYIEVSDLSDPTFQ